MNISRFKNQFKLYYVGLSALCCVGVTCVCGAAVSEQTQENEVARAGVHLSPGKVNIGTRSSAYHPVVITQQDAPAVPMISGNTIRHMARVSPAVSAKAASVSSARVAQSAQSARANSVSVVRTTKVTSGGGGGGGDAAASSYTSHRQKSGLSYGVSSVGGLGAVPVPVMAKAGRSYAAENNVMGEVTMAEESFLSGKNADPLRGGPGNPGTPDEPGVQPIPVGHTPWLLMLLLAVGYGISKRRQHLVNT